MWQQYISDDLIKNFETENNCKVNLSYMSDNADAINKLTAGGGDEYDLIMTCDAYMKSLIESGQHSEFIQHQRYILGIQGLLCTLSDELHLCCI